MAGRHPQDQGKHERPTYPDPFIHRATRALQAGAPRSPNRFEARRTDRRRSGARRRARSPRGMVLLAPYSDPGDRIADRFVSGVPRRRTEYVLSFDRAAARPSRQNVVLRALSKHPTRAENLVSRPI